MRLVVTGGRDYANCALVARVLAVLRPTRLAHGAARGADTLAAEFAATLGTEVVAYPAQWQYPDGGLDRGAGFKRNATMLRTEQPDLVLAFPGGKGTAHCVATARSLGIPVLQVLDGGES